MTDNVEIVKKLFDACQRKDFETVKSLVHPEYTLKDPLMELHGVQELIDMMENCPSGGAENLTFISEGDKIVSVFDGVMKEPVFSRMRMCSVITLKDGKVFSEEMFYDTAQVPEELAELMQKSIPESARTAHLH